MKFTNDDLAEEVAKLKRGIKAGHKDFKIDIFFAEWLVDNVLSISLTKQND